MQDPIIVLPSTDDPQEEIQEHPEGDYPYWQEDQDMEDYYDKKYGEE